MAFFLAAGTLSVLTFVSWRILRYRATIKKIGDIPVVSSVFSPVGLFGFVLPTSTWNPGIHWMWKWREHAYLNHTHDIISIVSYFDGDVSYWTGSPDVAAQLLRNESKNHLIKPPAMTTLPKLWGDSLISSSGEMWKRHRRIVAPAFGQKTYDMVFAESVALYKEMTSTEGWDTPAKDQICIHEVDRHILRFASIIIMRCGFGMAVSWQDTADSVQGQESLSLSQALRIVGTTGIARLAIPRWAYLLPITRVREIEQAWTTVRDHMRQLVNVKRQDICQEKESSQPRVDIFNQIVAAYDGIGKYGLNEEEAIANTVTLMFAGHETTAKAIVATLALLALHPAEQEKAYMEIRSKLPTETDPLIEDIHKLPYVLACFAEALRIYPAGILIPRLMTEDTVIQVHHPVPRSIVLPKGSWIAIDMIGAHHNPHFFAEPERYLPSRWSEVSEHDFSMFSRGPRACIGQKFSQTEAVCFIALLLRDWKIEPILEGGESTAGYFDRVMGEPKLVGFAFGLQSVPLKLVRRE